MYLGDFYLNLFRILDQSNNRTVSIKRPGLNFPQKSLLNVRYDRKNAGLNILSTRSYNRVVRVLGTTDL